MVFRFCNSDTYKNLKDNQLQPTLRRGLINCVFALRFHFALFTLRFSLCAFVKKALYFYLCFFL